MTANIQRRPKGPERVRVSLIQLETVKKFVVLSVAEMVNVVVVIIIVIYYYYYYYYYYRNYFSTTYLTRKPPLDVTSITSAQTPKIQISLFSVSRSSLLLSRLCLCLGT